MSIDVLVKNDKSQNIHKNIGRIFRKHNIIEYKGPGDYLSLDDFYKVYGYACFYKADVNRVNEIGINELTISFISERYPGRLMKHLQNDVGLKVTKIEAGIYYVMGDKIPMQVIVTKELSTKENLWLRNLTNKKEFQEVKEMCEALEELMYEELEEKRRLGLQEGLQEGLREGEKRVNALTLRLYELGRTDDIIKAALDKEYQKKLFEEFGL